MRDETKRSDVTLGLWYMGLMRSPSVGGVYVSEREDGLQMAGRPRDLWTNGGSAVRACGKEAGLEAAFQREELFLCLWTGRLALPVKDFAGWLLQLSHTLG